MGDASFITHVLDQLDAIDHLEAKAMFGGHGLYAGGPIFGIVHDDRLYFKTDGETVGWYEAAGMGPFRPYDDERTMGTYREVPVEVIEDREELIAWSREAIAVAHDA